jgi:hypothetical protein
MASICSVTRIVPSSVAMALPERPVTMSAVKIGESSRASENATEPPTYPSAANLLSAKFIWSANTIPAASPVAPTMNVDPTPMKAIWARMRSGRNGGRKIQANASAANRIIRPKSSKAALIRSIMARHSRTAAGTAPVSRAPRTVRPPRAAAILRAPMIKVGGEVDAFCTRCQLTLAHTVHAVVSGRPVKVECNTCHTVHRYRGSAGATASSVRSAARGERPARERAVVAFDELLAAKKTAGAQPYSPKRTYAVDDVVDHPIFGRGFVSAVKDATKIEVTFRSDVKILVQSRG